MATAYRWSEEMPQELKPVLGQAGISPLTPRLTSQLTVRDDEKGATAEKRRIVPGRVLGAVRRRYCKRPAMVEFYTVKRIDNSRLVRHVEPVKLRNLYKTVALGSIVAVFCMMYIYQHFRCIDLSFQLEDLKSKQVQGQSLNSELKLEIETLRAPQRIDVIAQKELGLRRPDSAQMREYANPDGAEVAAVQYGRSNHP